MSAPAAVNIDVGGLANGLFGLIDNLFTSEEEREKAKLELLAMMQRGELAQLAVNAEEAKHESLFVAGWRPAVGWACGAALAWNCLLQPFAAFVAFVAFKATGQYLPVDALPRLDLSEMMPVLLGMLGLGGLRTLEKRSGANKNR